MEVCNNTLFSKLYKEQAVKLSDEIGVKKAAGRLDFSINALCAGSRERRKEYVSRAFSVYLRDVLTKNIG